MNQREFKRVQITSTYVDRVSEHDWCNCQNQRGVLLCIIDRYAAIILDDENFIRLFFENRYRLIDEPILDHGFVFRSHYIHYCDNCGISRNTLQRFRREFELKTNDEQS